MGGNWGGDRGGRGCGFVGLCGMLDARWDFGWDFGWGFGLDVGLDVGGWWLVIGLSLISLSPSLSLSPSPSFPPSLPPPPFLSMSLYLHPGLHLEHTHGHVGETYSDTWVKGTLETSFAWKVGW